MDEYLTFLQVERVTHINSTCLMAYMDAGLLPFKLQAGVRLIRRSQARKLTRLHIQLTGEFLDCLIDQAVDDKAINEAVTDREGRLYFRWLSLGKKLPVGQPKAAEKT